MTEEIEMLTLMPRRLCTVADNVIIVEMRPIVKPTYLTFFRRSCFWSDVASYLYTDLQKKEVFFVINGIVLIDVLRHYSSSQWTSTVQDFGKKITDVHENHLLLFWNKSLVSDAFLKLNVDTQYIFELFIYSNTKFLFWVIIHVFLSRNIIISLAFGIAFYLYNSN